MSPCTEPSRESAGGGAWQLWRPAGLLYLGIALIGLALGLWPESMYPTRSAFPAAPLPALQTLAAALVLYALLVHPLVLMRRRGGTCATSGSCSWRQRLVCAGELAVYYVAAVPLLFVAAYLGDAVPLDVARVMLYLLGPFAVGWTTGDWLAISPASRPLSSAGSARQSALILLCVVLALGLPAGYYLCLEFLPESQASEFFRLLAPVTFAWETAASRQPLLPQPIWPFLVYPLLAAAMATASWAFRPRKS